MKILAIDDNPDNLLSLKAIINDAFPKCEYFSALSGRKGIELAQQKNPDIVFLDIIMPEMDGFQVCQYFKQNEFLQEIPIVFLTAIKEDRAIRLKALEFGAEGFLSKPIDEIELTAQIKAMFKIRSASLEKSLEKKQLKEKVEERTKVLNELNFGLQTLQEASLCFSREESESELYIKIAHFLKKLTGGAITTFGLYDPVQRAITVKHADLEKSVLNDLVVTFGGKALSEIKFPFGEELYNKLVNHPSWYVYSLTDATFGVIPQGIGKIIQRSQKVERFLGVAYILDHVLYGASMVALRSETPDPPFELVQSFANMAAIALQRLKAEKSLRISELRYKSITENAFDMIALLDLNGNYIYCNNAYQSILGYAPDQLIGHSCFELVPSNEKEIVSQLFRKHLTEKSEINGMVLKVASQDGSIKDVDHNAKMIYNDQGEFTNILLISKDLTQFRISEEVSRQNAERLQRAELVSKSGNWEFHLDSKKIYASVGAMQIYGFSKSALDYSEILEIPLAEYRPVLNDALKNLIKFDQPYDIEFKIKTADTGEIKDIHSIAFWDKSKNILFGIIQDISVQKQMERTLHENEQSIQSIFETMSEGVALNEIILDSNNQMIDYRIIKINNAFCSLVELEADQIIGKKATELYKLDNKTISDFWQKHQHSNSTLISEMKSPINGKWYYISTSPLHQGKFITTFFDITDRKTSEIAIRQERSLFRTLIDNLPDTIFIKDSLGRKTLANAMDLKHMGCSSEEEAIGKTDFDFFSKEEAIEFSKDDKLVLNGESLINKEEKVILQNGEITWMSTSKIPLRNENQEIIGLLGIGHNITDKKLAENALKESNELNLSLLKSIPFPMDIVDEEGNILFQSQSFKELFNADVIGEKCWKVYRDEKSQCRKCPLLQGIKLGETDLFETDGILGGKMFQISHTGMIYQGKKAFLEIFQDITAKKEVEKRVKLLAHSLENISECVTITDLKENILYVNDSLLKTYGYLEHELLGQHIRVLRGGLVAPEVETSIHQSTAEKGWRGEIMNKKKDGSAFPILLSTSSIKDEEGHFIASIGVAIDITEIRKNRSELIAAKEKAEESNLLKSAFLSNMSHEIRTPMNAIIGFSNLMTEAEESERISFAEIVQKSSKQLLTLIDDVILLSRLQSEKIPLNKTIFKPSEIIDDIFLMFNHPDLKNDLEIITRYSTDDQEIYINADLNKIKQVLTNFVTNAVKYTPTGYVEIGFRLKNDMIEFFVKDSGIGIPAMEHEKIFDSFYRSQEVILSAIGGTGLGLNIAKELVNLMEGTIGVKSAPGEGSYFYFSIPLELIDKVQDNLPKIPENKKNLKEIILLIADDEPVNFHYLEILLKGKVNKIDHASNGKIAVEMATNNNYTLILMDLKMPVMGGLEATRRIKQHSPSIPIIAQTAYSMPEEKEMAFQAGCDEFISKPIKRAELFELIDKYV